MTGGAPGIDRLLSEWTLDPLSALLAVAAAGAYLGAAARVRRWPALRTAAFLAGLAVLLLAVASGIDAYATDLLSVHMLQHLLLTMGAAFLLVAGAPLTLAVRALRRPWRQALAATLRGPVIATLTRPAVAWSGFAAVLVATHVPAVYDLALRNPGVHALMHALYLWAAVLFWVPLVAAEPLPRRLGPVGGIAYLLLAMVPMTAIAVWLLASDVVYPHYASMSPELGVSALADQRDAGAVMWVGGTVALVVAVAWCGWSALVREERRVAAREAYADRRPHPAGGRR